MWFCPKECWLSTISVHFTWILTGVTYYVFLSLRYTFSHILTLFKIQMSLQFSSSRLRSSFLRGDFRFYLKLSQSGGSYPLEFKFSREYFFPTFTPGKLRLRSFLLFLSVGWIYYYLPQNWRCSFGGSALFGESPSIGHFFFLLVT